MSPQLRTPFSDMNERKEAGGRYLQTIIFFRGDERAVTGRTRADTIGN